jgi:hypothetical protein
VDPNVLDLDDMDVLGVAVLPETFRLGRLELLGARTDRELTLLRLRLIGLELAGARPTLEGVLALGAGAGADLAACRPVAEPLPELDLFRSAFAPKLDTGSRIKAQMRATMPILISCRCLIAIIICLLSVSPASLGGDGPSEPTNSRGGQDFCSNYIRHQPEVR